MSTTDPITIRSFMLSQIAELKTRGWRLTLLSGDPTSLLSLAETTGVLAVAVDLQRDPSPRADLRALASIAKYFHKQKPLVSITSTPKISLLVSVAAWVRRTPHRIYILRGLRLETTRGPARVMLWMAEWLTIWCSTEVIVVSPSLLSAARSLRLIGRHKGQILGAGSSAGVDIPKYRHGVEGSLGRELFRRGLQVPESAFVFGYIGRLTRDKGILDLCQAFSRLEAEQHIWLILLGPLEDADLESSLKRLGSSKRVRLLGPSDESVSFYHAIDALVLPTHREGFPNVCLEAAAAGRPVIATTATGAVDSVRDGETGILISPRNPEDLAKAMMYLAAAPDVAATMGRRGAEWVAECFDRQTVTTNFCNFIESLVPEPQR